MKEQKRVGIYSRVSTSGQNPKMQIAELREYCHNRNWNIADEYTDAAFSGAKDSRPELDRLMKDAHRRRFDVVAVWKFDRFARSVSHLLRALETFQELGINFVSLSECLDTSVPAGKMAFTVLGAVAELERSLIAERVRSGLQNAKANGTKLGRPPLRVLSDGEIRRLRRERKQGVSFKKLAQIHGVSVWAAFELCKRPNAA
jgi:DNA invertase Pin-like site-specific DNA recombinase